MEAISSDIETSVGAKSVPLQAELDQTRPPSTLKFDHAHVHPIEGVQQSHEKLALHTKRALQAATYGSAFPMRRMMQESVLSQFHRLPGLPSSGIALEILRGKDADMDFDDYLNLPQDSPDGQVDTLGATHEALERATGMAPKAPF